jgi:hypothetical protein
MKKIKTTINDKEIEISSVPLRALLEVLEEVETLPAKVKDFDMKDESSNVQLIAKLISESGNEIFGILSKLSGIAKEEIAELDLADTIRLFKVLLEVNDIQSIKKEWGEISKMFPKAKK